MFLTQCLIRQTVYLLSYLLTYLLTYLLAPWGKVLREKLTGFQLARNSPHFL